MKNKFFKNGVILSLFILIATMAFSTSASAYSKVIFKRAFCPSIPGIVYAKYNSCSVDSGKWIAVYPYNKSTNEEYHYNIMNDRVQIINNKTKKIAVTLTGPQASALLLVTNSRITKEALVQALMFTYKISEPNAKTHVANVMKVVTNLNFYDGSRITNHIIPDKYLVYKF